MNTRSNRLFRKFLYGIALAILISSLGYGTRGPMTAHGQQAAVPPYKIYLPLVFRAPNNQALTINKNGTGNGTVTSSPAGIGCGSTCSAFFNFSTIVTLTAIADINSTFNGWSGSGCSGSDTCVVTMDTARSVTATFMLKTYRLRIGKGGTGSGSVISDPPGIDCGSTCSYSFVQNTIVTLTATPVSPAVFAGWNGSGCSGTGTCQVTMNADKQVSATFNLTNLPCSGIGNCDFESGRNGQWTEYSSNDLEIITDCSNILLCYDIKPHSGDWLAWLGGEINEISYIQQQILVASSAPYLLYWQWIDSFDDCGYDYDYVEVFINNTRVDKYDLCAGTNTTEWVQHSINLSTYAERSVKLQIRAQTNGNGYSHLFIDDVSLQASP